MKIQDMRSGILHLNRRAETEERDNVLELRPSGVQRLAAVSEPDDDLTGLFMPSPAEAAETKDLPCELDLPQWAVVSFSQIEAGGLTYRQAAALLDELELNNGAGLCIVTDETARRISH